MLIKTPLNYYREFIPAGYMDNLYAGFTLMHGSATILQEDFSGVYYTPDTVLTRDSDNCINVSDSALVAHGAGTWRQIGVDEDALIMFVGTPEAVADTDLCVFGVGSAATSGMACRFQMAYSAGAVQAPIVKDGTTQLTAVSTRTDGSADPALGNILLGAIAWDRSVGLEGYLYNISTETVIDQPSVAQVANLAVTPTAVTRLDNFAKLYGALVFTFPSGGLPAIATWKADVLTIANSLIALKS